MNIQVLCVALATVCLISCASADEWKLVWSDEFDYTGLPDPAKWRYEEGYVRNQEAQYYTKDRRENARVENGMLVIEGRKDNMPNPKFDPKGKGPATQPTVAYTSASITTEGTFAWTYGRIEARAKLPKGKGVWPAIWMLGTNISTVGWPKCGEIDIMEYVGHTPNAVYGTLHWGRSYKSPDKKSSGKEFKTPAPADDFHIYAIEWTPERIDLYYDKTLYHTVPLEKAQDGDYNPFKQPQYLLINLALGGSWGREIDDSILPQKYLVDYVRVYQKEGPVQDNR